MSFIGGAIYFGANLVRVCCTEPEGTIIYDEEQELHFADDLTKAYIAANGVHSVVSILIQTVAKKTLPVNTTISIAIGHISAFGVVTLVNKNITGFHLDQASINRIALTNFSLHVKTERLTRISSYLYTAYVNI